MKPTILAGAAILACGCATTQVNAINRDSVEIWADGLLTSHNLILGEAVRMCALYDRHPKWVGYRPRQPKSGDHVFACTDDKHELALFDRKALTYDPSKDRGVRQ